MALYKLEISLTIQMSCFISSVFCSNKRCLRPAYYAPDSLLYIRTLSTAPQRQSASVLKGFDRNDLSWGRLVCMSSTCPQETHAHFVKSINLVHNECYYR